MQKDVTIRICSTCDRPLPWSDEDPGQTGWLCCDEYYCSEECLYKSFNDDYEVGKVLWEEHYRDGDDCYFTDWELEELE